jgi:hypothetical protein
LAELERLSAALYLSSAERAAWRADPDHVARLYHLDPPATNALLGVRVEALEFYASGLRQKRFHEVTAFLPATVGRWQRTLQEMFGAYAETHVPVGPKKHVADAVAFARYLIAHAKTPAGARDALRFDMIPWELNFRVVTEPWTYRASGVGALLVRADRVHGPRWRVLRFDARMQNRPSGHGRPSDSPPLDGRATLGVFVKLPFVAQPFEWYLPWSKKA